MVCMVLVQSFRRYKEMGNIVDQFYETINGSVAKFSKGGYTLEKKNKENHKCDTLKENSSRKILF